MDEKAQAERAAYRRAYTRVKDFKETFESESGKKMLFELMKFCGFLGKPFSKDPCQTAYDAGQRDVIGWILTNMKVKEREILRILEEAENNDRTSSSGDYA